MRFTRRDSPEGPLTCSDAILGAFVTAGAIGSQPVHLPAILNALPPFRSLRLHALLALLLAISQAHASVASATPSAPAAAPHDDATVDPWFAGFDDAVLTGLQRQAHVPEDVRTRLPAAGPGSSDAAELPLDARVAYAYVELKTLTLRLAIAQQLRAGLARERQIRAGQSPSPQAAAQVADIQSRLVALDIVLTRWQAQQREGLATLALLCGMSLENLRLAIENRQVPAVPVHAAAPRELATPVADLTKVALPDPVAPAAAIAQLGTNIATLREVLVTRQVEAEAIERRWRLGAASEEEALGARERWLVEQDRLAVSSGALAVLLIENRVATDPGSAPAVQHGARED